MIDTLVGWGSLWPIRRATHVCVLHASVSIRKHAQCVRCIFCKPSMYVACMQPCTVYMCFAQSYTTANAIATIAVLTKLKIVCEERGPPTIYIHTSHLQENSSLARCQLPVLYIIRISAPGNIPKASEPIMIACRREVQGSLYETR